MCSVNQRPIIILLKLNINHILLKIKVQVKPSFDFPIFRSLLKAKKNNQTALNYCSQITILIHKGTYFLRIKIKGRL